MAKMGGSLKRRDLLRKAGVATVVAALGTALEETPAKVAEGDEPIHIIIGDGGGGNPFFHRGPKPRRRVHKAGVCSTPWPTLLSTMPSPATAVIITQKKPSSPPCQDDYTKYFPNQNLAVFAWYEVKYPTIVEEDEGYGLHGAITEVAPTAASVSVTVAPLDISHPPTGGPLYIVLMR